MKRCSRSAENEERRMPEEKRKEEGERERNRIIGEAIRSTNDRARDYVRRCLISSCEPVLGEEVSRLHQV